MSMTMTQRVVSDRPWTLDSPSSGYSTSQPLQSLTYSYDAIAGNVDDPEGALDALMQVYVYGGVMYSFFCVSIAKIGWSWSQDICDLKQ